MSGKFIVIDGIEGAGKSTQMQFIVNYFQEQGKKVVQTREPGGSPLGEKLRNILLHDDISITPLSELLLMFAARHQHIHETILPAMQQGAIVISDRFVDSSYAYQGGGRNIDISIIEQLEHLTLAGFTPDLTLFLNLPLEVALERISKRDKSDRIEGEDDSFFQRTYEGYQQRLQRNSHIKIINSAQSIEETQQQILQLLHAL